LRVLFFVSHFFPHRGGLINYVYYLSQELRSSGHEVVVVTNNTHKTKVVEVINGITVFRVDCKNYLNGNFPWPLKDSFDLLSEHWNADLVITNTRFYLLNLFGLRWAKKQGIPTLHVEHGTCHSALKNPLVSLINRLVDHTLGWYVIKNSDYVAGVSIAATKFMKHLRKRKDFVVLPNSVNTQFFSQKTSYEIKGLPVLTFIGRLVYGKGVQDLILAVKDLPLKLLVIGIGDYENKLRRLAGSNVSFLGTKNSQEIKDILHKTTLLINPSYSEGLPTCVLEAGSCGVPVIATDVGGTKEILGEFPVSLVQPKNIEELRKTIQYWLQYPTLRKQYGQSLRNKIVNEYDWHETTQKLLKITKW